MDHIGPYTYFLGQPMIKTPTTEEANILYRSSTEKNSNLRKVTEGWNHLLHFLKVRSQKK